MGVAVTIGLNLSDFFDMTPQEFYEVWSYCSKAKEDEHWDAWNRMRYEACIMLQPHTKKGSHMTPQKLFPLPIDKTHPSAPPISKEERQARLKRRLQQLEDLKNKPKDNGIR